ncbi:hypothetical protein G6011_03465 [Alternaria panax]|uniref:Uncharacterized protein n=1 Tax=Alternaria panax TaxID=48097 RepID=A0AAD4IF89_9PLEO|nr:hypothetical protein G6011_03465 [Alternaria panax]
MSRALIQAEQSAKDGILEPLLKSRNTALRPEENPNGRLPVLTMSSTSPDDDSFSCSTLCTPASSLQVAPTSTPAPLTPDAEFRIIEAELANCERTREALARREAALRERKAEIIRETKMRLDKEVRELVVGDRDEEMNESLCMRNVQRRVETRLEKAHVNTDEAMEEKA